MIILLVVGLLAGCGSEAGVTQAALAAPTQAADYGACQDKAAEILKYRDTSTKITYYTDSAPYYLLVIQFPGASYYLDWETDANYCNVKSYFF